MEDIKKWWNVLLKYGFDLGYFFNVMKCWFIIKLDKEVVVCILFDGMVINVIVWGYRYFGVVLGFREYLEEYVS